MTNIRIHAMCSGLAGRPYLPFALVVIIGLDVIPMIAYLLSDKSQPYKRDRTDPKIKMDTCGLHVVSISRTWTEPFSVITVYACSIAMETLYTICLVDWWAKFCLAIVIILVLMVLCFNGWGERGKYHSIPASLLFTTLYGFQIAMNSEFIGWFTGDAQSTANSVITLINGLVYALLLGLAIASYMDEQKQWPPWLCIIEHLFLYLISAFLLVITGVDLVYP